MTIFLQDNAKPLMDRISLYYFSPVIAFTVMSTTFTCPFTNPTFMEYDMPPNTGTVKCLEQRLGTVWEYLTHFELRMPLHFLLEVYKNA